MQEMAKTYDPSVVESKWYACWEHGGYFRSVPDDRPPYTVVIPPPNVTGVLHMGHMLNNTIQDALVRRKRMQGYNACWVPGTDHASIATEAKVVAWLRELGLNKREIGREKFLEYAFEWKEKYGGIILQQLRKLGASCDWERTRFTMEDKLSAAVIEVFVDLYNKGLIYRGLRMVNWDPQGRTVVSNEEVLHEERQGKLWYVRYKVADTADDWIVIATTRPETIWADVAIAVHPENETYGRLIGREALIPLWDGEKRIPILGDPGIDKDFGTGCLKVTPAHDALDYEIGLRHGLPVVDILNDDGTLAAWAGKYAGLDRFEARKVFAADLEAAGHVVKTETVTNNVGLSERTKAVIEPRLSLQWFVRMEEFVKPALRAVVEGEVKLIPGHFVNTYRHWMENVRDWCISRQLWWGQRVPAYYYPRWEFDTYSREWLPVHGVQDVAVATSREQAFEIAMKNGFQGSIDELVQDEDCLDTWFSSWLWPISVFDGFDDPNNPDINYYYPTNDLVTAPEILFFWVARMIIAGYEWRGQRPFENVYLTGIVRDKLGRKMSKSLGNSPDPLELIAKYSADGVRVGMLLCSPAGNDLKFDESLCEQGRNFVNKLWNAYRLVHGWGGQLSDRAANPTETLALEWFAQRVAEAAHELEGQFGQFRLSEALMTVYKLVWDDFCSWFLEVLKPGREDGLSREVYSRTLDLFEDLLRLLHPFTPFITEEIWNALRPRADRELLIVARLPEFASPDGARLRDMEEIREVVTALRAFRSEKNLAYKIVLPVAIKTRRTELFTAYLPVVQKLANVEFAGFADQSVAGAFSVVVRSHELYITAEGAVDLEAERKKLTDEIEYTEGFRRSVEAKLANEKFVANAKPELVEKERQKLADALAKLATLRESLAHLGA